MTAVLAGGGVVANTHGEGGLLRIPTGKGVLQTADTETGRETDREKRQRQQTERQAERDRQRDRQREETERSDREKRQRDRQTNILLHLA